MRPSNGVATSGKQRGTEGGEGRREERRQSSLLLPRGLCSLSSSVLRPAAARAAAADPSNCRTLGLTLIVTDRAHANGTLNGPFLVCADQLTKYLQERRLANVGRQNNTSEH
ncbi:hypothetical protein EVAR_20611_1 [Eumeta japonica]|uniref:Uncharacterized protein n=1 Tax=Eumeta variegata TaxID=151549 RepID=A0A4C1US13_EUMVA|nr:hypothetical protein EVAR_20611_1 [Eumeta japonica]